MKISVIIPVINEAPRVGPAIASSWAAGVDQVIVVDGGSVDGTDEVAGRHECLLLRSEPGRAVQQNAGAAVAEGDLLLFLHV
ncbi:MAG: glycosyltransferase, partial [Mariniblastus sp.]|nr:glycosyltransferase [Mariniblastus sp.]